MAHMIDAEVGELWRKRIQELEQLYPDRKGAVSFEMDVVIALVGKLVEETAQNLYYQSNDSHHDAWEGVYILPWNSPSLVQKDLRRKYTKQALLRYDIPEEEWPSR